MPCEVSRLTIVFSKTNGLDPQEAKNIISPVWLYNDGSNQIFYPQIPFGVGVKTKINVRRNSVRPKPQNASLRFRT